jgi:hypothetical protein
LASQRKRINITHIERKGVNVAHIKQLRENVIDQGRIERLRAGCASPLGIDFLLGGTIVCCTIWLYR